MEEIDVSLPKKVVVYYTLKNLPSHYDMIKQVILHEKSPLTSRITIFYDNFVSFWTRQSKHFGQLGRVIPNIHVTLDHICVTFNISCHFGQCHKRSCFLLVSLYLELES